MQADEKHIMLDLETLGIAPGCAIISIGAVEIANGSLGREFKTNIAIESNLNAGLAIESDALEWWLDNAEIYRTGLRPHATSLRHALESLSQWLPDRAVSIWGNGSDFDCAILAAAYRKLGMPIPWPPKRERCYRTLKTLFPEIEIRRTGQIHDSLHDARNQADHLIRIFRHIEELKTESRGIAPQAISSKAIAGIGIGIIESLREQSGHLTDESSPHPSGPISRETCGRIKRLLGTAADLISAIHRECSLCKPYATLPDRIQALIENKDRFKNENPD